MWRVPAVKSFERFVKLLDGIEKKVGPDARIVLWFDN
jgi:hypothetical protein